jgi:hypothetical protein
MSPRANDRVDATVMSCALAQAASDGRSGMHTGTHSARHCASPVTSASTLKPSIAAPVYDDHYGPCTVQSPASSASATRLLFDATSCVRTKSAARSAAAV